MKKVIISGLVSVLLLGLCLSTQAKSKTTKIYVFGFAASFNDSTVYFTDIQYIDQAQLTGKGNFLAGRNSYSNQLRDYLAGQGMEHRTCIVSYAKKQKDAQKKYDKMMSRYLKGKKGAVIYNVKRLDADKFHFQPVTVNEEAQEKNVKASKATKSKKKK